MTITMLLKNTLKAAQRLVVVEKTSVLKPN
jgi:5,10-methylene-tetrahydrofolate dehydrogenase/methenyl tetrahydrofolate cyclohydrolase